MMNGLPKVIMIFVVVLLTGCQVSEAESLESVEENFLDSFTTEQRQPNEERAQLSMYKPRGVSIVEESDYNLVLENKSQTLLLFFNPIEALDSTANLERDREFEKDALLFETVEQDGRVGYVVVLADEHENYKLMTGIGGAKMTSIVPLEDLADTTTVMLEMLHSLEPLVAHVDKWSPTYDTNH